jgi:protocatechuate 3,4-dioxygenase beta subunit
MQERSDTDGKVYTVQYFERAIFELHPGNQPPYDVLLSLLGVFRYKQKYPYGAPDQVAKSTPSYQLFPETGKRVGCEFLDYWLENGGLMQQGYPISDEFMEVSDLDGQPHKVQYFQRAVFELHTENEPPNRVLLSPLSTFRYGAKYAGQTLQSTATPTSEGCVATPHGGTTTNPKPDAPVRSSVGTGHIMKGVVKSEQDCAPIAGAKIVFWLAGPDGEYDDAHTASVFTNSSGAYTFESNYPGLYSGRPVPHIHLYASADGYRGIETEYFPVCDETEAILDIILARNPDQATPTPAAGQ